MTHTQGRWERYDTLAVILILVGYVAWLLATVHHLGYARDEGFYFQAAQSYENWFALLLDQPRTALTRDAVDRWWSINHEHPAFMKSLFALSHRYLYTRWHLFAEAGTSFRFPGMVVSALGPAVVYAWGRLVLGRLSGLVAALSLALMPRVFYHAHLDCFDAPVASLWLLTTFLFWLSLERGGWRYALLTGLAYGILLNTKHNSWLLPGALLAYYAVIHWRPLKQQASRGGVNIPLAFLAMGSLGPIILYASWPWIWFDTGERLVEYYRFHTQHEYYNMEFLGETYWKPPMPRLYAWVMTLATVPGITLLLFAIGVGAAVYRLIRRPAGTGGSGELHRALVLWGVGVLASYAPWWSPQTPIFGGTKHWITAYPFLALLAGFGFLRVGAWLRELAIPWPPWPRRLCEPALALTVLIGPLAMTLESHPWGLTFYTPLVGGSPGAATLGLNRGFWGYTTGAVQDFLNQQMPQHSELYLHDTAQQSFSMLVADGRIRQDIHGTLNPAASRFGLYHHEQHMSRVEQSLWVLYGTTAPAHVATYQGVPVIWVYARPGSP